MFLADPAPFGGRLNTTVEYAVRAALIREALAEKIPRTQPPKAISWLGSSSPVRSCRCVSILRREHLKSTGTVVVATFWKARVTCAMCYWQKDTTFTTSSL